MVTHCYKIYVFFLTIFKKNCPLIVMEPVTDISKMSSPLNHGTQCEWSADQVVSACCKALDSLVQQQWLDTMSKHIVLQG